MPTKYTMNETEFAARAEIKALHARVRAALKARCLTEQRHPQLGTTTTAYIAGHRYVCLAWAFLRGFSYRRVERRRHFQTNGGALADMFSAPVLGRRGAVPFEHDAPDTDRLAATLRVLGAPFGTYDALRAWLSEPSPDLPYLLAADEKRAARVAEDAAALARGFAPPAAE